MWARCGKSDSEVCVCYGLPITWPRVVFHDYFANELCFVLGVWALLWRQGGVLESYEKQFGNFIWCDNILSAVFLLLHKLLSSPSPHPLTHLLKYCYYFWICNLRFSDVWLCTCCDLRSVHCHLLWLICWSIRKFCLFRYYTMVSPNLKIKFQYALKKLHLSHEHQTNYTSNSNKQKSHQLRCSKISTS